MGKQRETNPGSCLPGPCGRQAKHPFTEHSFPQSSAQTSLRAHGGQWPTSPGAAPGSAAFLPRAQLLQESPRAAPLLNVFYDAPLDV